MNDAGRTDATAAFGVPDSQIPGIRAAFIASWKSGRKPRMEEFVEQAPPHLRSRLLQELVAAEIELRRVDGETPRLDEFLERFPGEHLAIGQLVSDSTHGAKGNIPPNGDRTSLATFAPSGIRSRTDSPELTTDATRIGDYELQGLLGRGGMGEVFRARQRNANRIVALKVIRSDFANDPASIGPSNALKRFQAEAQAAARLEHENIVTVYDVGQSDGRQFFAMRLVEGTNLAEVVASKPVSPRKAAEYLEPVARALAYAHKEGILHRDIKPRNILIDSADKPYIADFGLAKGIRDAADLTKSGEVLGTPSYMAPEQARDSAHVGPAVDIYGLGATLYHLIVGRPPFQSAEPVETLRQVLHEDPIPPRRLNPAIDKDLETICLRCLEKEPARRYGSAEAVANDLKRYLDGDTIIARPIGRLGRTWRWCRRNRLNAALLFSIACLLVVTAFVSSVAYFQTNRALMLSRQSEETERKLRQQAQREKDLAESNFSKAYQTANRFLFNFDMGIYNIPSIRDLGEMRRLRHNLLSQAVENYREMLAERDNDENITADLAETLVRLSDVNQQLGNLDESRRNLAEVIRLRERLAAEHPQTPRYRRELGLVYLDAAERNLTRGNLEESISPGRKAAELLSSLIDDLAARAWAAESGLTERQLDIDVLDALSVLDRIYEAAGDLANREKNIEQALTAAEHAIRRTPEFIGFRIEFAEFTLKRARIHRLAGRDAEASQWLDRAEELWRQVVERCERYVEENPDKIEFIAFRLCESYRSMAAVFALKNDASKAELFLRKSVDRMRKPLELRPQSVVFQQKLGDAMVALGEFLCAAGRASEAADVASSHREWALKLHNGQQLANAASTFARCAAVVEKDAASKPADLAGYQEEALKTLKLALENKVRNVAGLIARPEFAVLDARQEFQELKNLLSQRKPAESSGGRPTP